MPVMNLPLETYALKDADRILTPALLLYPELVDANIRAAVHMAGDDSNRWRPHIKTAKLAATVERILAHGVAQLKCSTTLELLTACQCHAPDVLLAFAVVGANARRVLEIAGQFPNSRISVLIESAEQARAWRGTNIGVFIDINPGMDRTGIGEERTSEVVSLARDLVDRFRGLHYYDGHAAGFPAGEREARVHQGYTRLLALVRALAAAGVHVGEVITSGTPAAPFAISYPGFRHAPFVHRISPGTVVYNDTTSLEQLPNAGYMPAAVVLSTVISHPAPHSITCDAGHKSVSADAGVPTCTVIGHPGLKPLKPSEEHLPIEGSSEDRLPQIGDKLYLIPRHVCPTVNNFDRALMIVNGRIASVETVTARGHEAPNIL
ncbi:MAG TPA: alanine racemase [Bryobacteraceae bacterium]|jgi:D-serine deaminase-like pyridoxal phosphate-dependent protein|nr:alanine racemase [Bryobacteraceae bacterium]